MHRMVKRLIQVDFKVVSNAKRESHLASSPTLFREVLLYVAEQVMIGEVNLGNRLFKAKTFIIKNTEKILFWYKISLQRQR